MMRHKLTIGTVAVAFALSAAPLAAQENPRSGGPGSRSSSGGERTGSAVPRGSGGSSGGGESTGGGMSGGSMGSSSSPSMPSSSGRMGRPAERSVDRAPRRGDGQATGRRAVPRGTAATGGSTTRTAGSGGSDTVDRSSAPERRAVRVNNRPRSDRPITGVATERRSPVLPDRNIFYIYRPYYNPWGFYGSGLGFGLGYLYYDPFWSGGAFGYPGYGGYGGYSSGGYYGSGGSYGSGGYGQAYGETGSLRLKLKPREAQVFVDGYFVGVVDSFDGIFQKLALDGGGHKVEVKADGYEPLEFDVLITPGETVTYKGEMQPVRN